MVFCTKDSTPLSLLLLNQPGGGASEAARRAALGGFPFLTFNSLPAPVSPASSTEQATLREATFKVVCEALEILDDEDFEMEDVDADADVIADVKQ